ncbi:MAG: hypothetical protein RRC34_14025 [Lentisphaeria bacterium]|nr:hypothetical protein [Lentisphaeria bacterium]
MAGMYHLYHAWQLESDQYGGLPVLMAAVFEPESGRESPLLTKKGQKKTSGKIAK